MTAADKLRDLCDFSDKDLVVYRRRNLGFKSRWITYDKMVAGYYLKHETYNKFRWSKVDLDPFAGLVWSLLETKEKP